MFGKMKCLSFWKIAIICLVFASVYENGLSADKKKDQGNQAENIFYASRTAFARVDPDKDADIVREVKQGERLKEIGIYDLPNWIQVKLSDGKIGWIPKNAISVDKVNKGILEDASKLEEEKKRRELREQTEREKKVSEEREREKVVQKFAEKRLVEEKIDSHEYNRAIKEINYLIEFIEFRKEFEGGYRFGEISICNNIERVYKEYSAEIPTYLTEKLISAFLKALKHRNWWARRDAAEGLGILKAKSAVPALKKALRDSEQWVQVKAAGALVKIGDKDGVKFLIEKLEKEFDKKEAEVFGRQYAIEVLGDSGDKLAIPVLQKYLCYPGQSPVGSVLPILAKEALGKIDKLALIKGEKAAKENKLRKLKQERVKAWRDLQSKKQIRTWEEYIELVDICVYLNVKLPKRGKGRDFGEEVRIDASGIDNIKEAPDSYVGRYFWSTVPRGLFGPMIEQMAYASGYRIKGNGCSFYLNFPAVPGYTMRKGYLVSRVKIPRRRYQDILCRFVGLEDFVNIYEEKYKLPVFQVIAVCGWNSLDLAGGRINKIFTCDTRELDQIIKKFKN